jgi:hypothetical protein
MHGGAVCAVADVDEERECRPGRVEHPMGDMANWDEEVDK